MQCKRRRCNILTLCFITFSICATFEVHGQKFSLGVKGGPTLNWAHFGDSEERAKFGTRIKRGYTVRGTIAFPLKNRYEFISEGGYSVKGRRVMFNDKQWENNNTYSFIDLTMLLRKSFNLHIKENIPTKWFINIGPELSYLLKSKGKIVAGGKATHYNTVFDQEPDANFHNIYYNNINRWLFALSIGVGFEAPITKTQKVSVELRLVSGHTYLGDKNSAYIEILGFDDTSLRQNLKILQLTAAYTFDLDLQSAKKGKSTLNKTIKKNR